MESDHVDTGQCGSSEAELRAGCSSQGTPFGSRIWKWPEHSQKCSAVKQPVLWLRPEMPSTGRPFCLRPYWYLFNCSSLGLRVPRDPGALEIIGLHMLWVFSFIVYEKRRSKGIPGLF